MLIAIVAALCSTLTVAQTKWGDKPMIDPIVPGTRPGAGGCYAWRTKGGSAWQVQCDASNCEKHRVDFVANNANTEAIGCAARISCFAYSHNNIVSCYTDRKQCETARARPNFIDATACQDFAKTGKADMSLADNYVQDNYQTCFASQIPGTPAFVNCYWSRATCADMSAQKKRNPGDSSNPAMSIMIGCTKAPLFCFSYNGGKNAACYSDGAACVANRNRIAGANPCAQFAGDGMIR